MDERTKAAYEMDERTKAAYELVGVLSWVYDTHPEVFPESFRQRVCELLRTAMPSWESKKER